MTPARRIRKYWVQFDPNTRRGAFWLDIVNGPQPELTKSNLTPEETAAVTAILATGRAVIFPNGSLGIEG